MKYILSLVLSCVMVIAVSAQQNMYSWRVGVHGGLGTYYGDLSTKRFLDPQADVLQFWKNKGKNLSYGLSIESTYGKAWGFRLKGTRGVFTANDRTQKWNGDYYTENDNFGRALNVRTTYWDADALLIYHFDNGTLLSEKAFFAPYIGFGVGYMNFKTTGDLLDKDGNRYHYWSDNTIRNIAENASNASDAVEIEQDGVYETSLQDLQTEREVNNAKYTFTLPVALGLKFRLTDRLNLNLETLLHYTLSDHIDDVSDLYPTMNISDFEYYASNPSGVNRDKRGNNSKAYDIYGLFNVSLGFNFGYKTGSFVAPVFYHGTRAIQRNEVQPFVRIDEPKDTVIVPEVVEELKIEVEKTDTIRPTTVVIEHIHINQNATPSPVVVQGQDSIVRDTIYQPGKVIYEKVIIQTDTIREVIREQVDTVAVVEEIEPVEIDTVVFFDAKTQQQDTIMYQGVTALEPVPLEPIFTPLVFDTIEAVEITPVFFEENIGIKRDDLQKEEVVLSEIQESNFELITLRNDINNLRLSDDKSQEEIELVYKRLDELENEAKEADYYSTNLDIEDTVLKDNIQDASTVFNKDLEQLRSEIIYLESNRAIDVDNFNKIKEENEKKIADLEKEMKKLRKQVRRSKRKDLPKRDYTSNKNYVWGKKKEDKPANGGSTLITAPAPVSSPTVTTVPSNNNDVVYQNRINELQRQLAIKNSSNEAQIRDLQRELAQKNSSNEAQIRALNQQINALKANKGQTEQAYIARLERKLDEVNRNLSRTQSELSALKNRPAPQPRTVYTQAPTRTVYAPNPVSPAKSAVDRLGRVSVFFNKGQTSIQPSFDVQLAKVLRVLQQYPEVTANITGYTDRSGNPEINFKISKQRSEAVSNYFTQRGINTSRINVNYYGEAQGSATNDPYARRVEINLIAY